MRPLIYWFVQQKYGFRMMYMVVYFHGVGEASKQF